MITTTTLRSFRLFLLTIIASLSISAAQATVYCNPTFSLGCSSWKVQNVILNTLNWSVGTASCSTYDYTSTGTTLTAGVSTPMSVTTGKWCGCTVWIDFNNNGSFDDLGENLYYNYNGAQTYGYNFNITVPASTPSGTYRMRVLGGWGSDGYSTTNTNGYGGCGTYQYGSYDDFTITVVGNTTCFQPTGLAITNITSGAATVSWTAPTSGTPIGYTWILVPTGAGATATPVASGTTTAPTTSAIASGLSASTTYDLYVHTTCSATDSSAWAGPVPFTTTALPACDTATGLSVTGITAAAAYFTWNAVSGASGYEYVLDQNAANPASSGTPTSNTFYYATSLLPGTTYYFHLRTDCSAAATTTSGWITIPVTTHDTCLPPTNVTASSITSTGAVINWTAPSGATGYQYVLDQIATAPTGSGTATTLTSYTASGLTSATTYYFHVRNVCSGTNMSVWVTIPITTLGTSGVNAVNGSGFVISAYPNPAQDVVTITTSGTQSVNATVLLTDLSGKTIQHIQLYNNRSAIDISSLAPGMYFIRYTDEIHQQTIKLVK
jgi:hypothetical protein